LPRSSLRSFGGASSAKAGIYGVKSAELEESDEYLAKDEGAAAPVQAHIASALLENVLRALERIAECLSIADAAVEL